MKSSVVRPWIILALIFLLGAATGSLLTIGLGPHFASAPPGAQEMRNHWMIRLTHRLNLTDDQQTKIQPIIFKAEADIQAVHHDDIGHISSIMKTANANIAQVLNSDQRAELQKMEQDRERMFFRHMHGPGHGPADFHHPAGEEGPPVSTDDAPPSS
jgi:Spy/CpxP family protein refolding chaperone